MHKVANKIQDSIKIPIIHIADVTIKHLIKQEIKSVALLGTKYTMEQDFYKERIIKNNIQVFIPNEEDRNEVNRIIYNELCKGIISLQSKKIYLKIIDKLIKEGAQAIILGCTEIGLLISQEDCNVQIFDTALLHAKEAALLSI